MRTCAVLRLPSLWSISCKLAVASDVAVIDIDGQVIDAHGGQQGRAFHGHCKRTIFMPLIASCAEDGAMLGAELQSGTQNVERDCYEFIRRVGLQVRCKRPVKYRSAAATGVPMGTGRLEGGEQVGLPDPAHSALGSYAALCLSACRAFCQ